MTTFIYLIYNVELIHYGLDLKRNYADTTLWFFGLPPVMFVFQGTCSLKKVGFNYLYLFLDNMIIIIQVYLEATSNYKYKNEFL